MGSQRVADTTKRLHFHFSMLFHDQKKKKISKLRIERNLLNMIKAIYKKATIRGFPGGSVVKNSPTKAGDIGSITGPRAAKPVGHTC